MSQAILCINLSLCSYVHPKKNNCISLSSLWSSVVELNEAWNCMLWKTGSSERPGHLKAAYSDRLGGCLCSLHHLSPSVHLGCFWLSMHVMTKTCWETEGFGNKQFTRPAVMGSRWWFSRELVILRYGFPQSFSMSKRLRAFWIKWPLPPSSLPQKTK